MMRPLPFAWPHAVAFWIVYAWSFAPEIRFMRQTRSEPKSGVDAGSLPIIVNGIQIAMAVAFFVAFLVPPFRMREQAFWSGLVLLIAGSALRRHCFRILGEYFTYAVRVREDQPVIDRGAYRWVRHPSYTGGTLLFAGLGLALTNWASLGVLLAATVIVYGYRVSVEEKALTETLGEPYRAYCATRKRFVPFLF